MPNKNDILPKSVERWEGQYLSQQSNSNYASRQSDMYDIEDHDISSSNSDFTSMPYSNEMQQSFSTEYDQIPSSFQQSLGFDSDPFATDALNRIVPLWMLRP